MDKKREIFALLLVFIVIVRELLDRTVYSRPREVTSYVVPRRSAMLVEMTEVETYIPVN